MSEIEGIGIIELLVGGGPYALLLFLLYLFYTGKVVSRNVVESIVKVAVTQVVEQMRRAVADGVRDALELSKPKKSEGDSGEDRFSFP